MIQWAERDLQSVSETDLVENYKIMRGILDASGRVYSPAISVGSQGLCDVDVTHAWACFFLKWFAKPASPDLPCQIMCLDPTRQAAFVQLTSTFNLHSQVYGVRGGRGLIKVSWPRHIICAVVCM